MPIVTLFRHGAAPLSIAPRGCPPQPILGGFRFMGVLGLWASWGSLERLRASLRYGPFGSRDLGALGFWRSGGFGASEWLWES
eukprot:4977023-Pyramimonas_sp.AAC.1